MLRRIVHEQMNVIVFAVHFDKCRLEIRTDLLEDHSEIGDRRHRQNSLAILRDEDQVNVHLKHAMSTVSYFT